MDNNKGLKLTISGFGKFGNVLQNPTSIIVSEMTEDFKKKYNIVHSEVLEVSTVACEKYVNQLPQDCVNLHFGVYDGSLQFNIEQCGYNLKDFGIPDMRGYIGNNECIEEDCQIDKGRQTKLNTQKIVQLLGKQFPVKESDDPGRYICNFIYYCSLKKASECPKAASLFVHFPAFRTIPKQKQLEFVEQLLETLHKLYKSGQLFQQ